MTGDQRVGSVFETVLAMPGQETGMRSVRDPLGRHRKPRAIDQRANAVRIVRLPADQDFQIVLQAGYSLIRVR